MQIVSESFGNIDIDLLLENNHKSYTNIINKIHIYNRNMQYNVLHESKRYNSNIRYTVSEQQDIRDMFNILRTHFLLKVLEESYKYSLNEGLFDTIKNTGQNIKNKVTNAWNAAKDWSDEQWVKIIQKTCPQFKNAFNLLNILVKSTIKNAQDLFNKLIELFSQISDQLRNVAAYLGAFGSNKVNDNDLEKLGLNSTAESLMLQTYLSNLLNSDKNINENGDTTNNTEKPISITDQQKAVLNTISDKDEKTFFVLLIDYIQSKLSGKTSNISESLSVIEASNTLNENQFGDWLRKKCANNKVLSVVLLNSFNGKKVGFFKTLIISLIGTVVITLLGMLAGSSVILSYVYLIVGLIWGTRGIIQLISKRYVQLRPGETLFQDKRFIMSLILTGGAFIMSVWSLATNFMHHMGLSTQKEAAQKIAEFMKEHNGHATPEEIKKFLDENKDIIEGTWFSKTLNTVVSKEDIAQSISDFQNDITSKMKGVPASKWNEVLKSLVDQGSLSLPDYTTNLTLNIKYPGGLEKWFTTDEFKNLLKEFNISSEDFAKIALQSTNDLDTPGHVHDGITYATVLSSNKFTPEFINKLDDLLKLHEGGCMNLGAGNTMKSVTNLFVKLAAISAPAASVIAPFFAVFDFMGTDDGYIIASLGTEASMKDYYFVSKIEQKSLQDVATIVKNTEGVKAIYQDNQTVEKNNENIIKNIDNEKISKLQQNPKYGDKIKNLVTNLQQWSDTKQHDVALWYGIHINDDDLKTLADSNPQTVEKWRNEHDKEELPILVLDPFTLTGYDVASDDAKIRKNPYFFKGIQHKLTVKPLFNKDKNTKEYIGKMFSGLIKNGVKVLCNSNAGVQKLITKQKGKYVITDECTNPDNPLKLYGNLTPNEICQVMNNDINIYSLTAAENSKNITLADGKIVSTNTNNENISKDAGMETYVQDNIIPVITNKNTDVYKEILEYSQKNKNFKKLFISENDELNTETILKYEMWLRRSMSTYGQKIDQSTIGNIGLKMKNLLTNIFKSKKDKDASVDGYEDLVKGKIKYSKEDLQNDWKDIAALAHIIWKYKGNKKLWQAQKDEMNDIDTSSSDNMSSSNKQNNNQVIEEKPKKSNKKEQNSNKGDKQISKEEIKKTLEKQAKWFNDIIIKRIDNENKSLYKLLCETPNAAQYFKLNKDNHNIDKIKKDKFLISFLFNRCKTSKIPSEKYWETKLPKLLIKAGAVKSMKYAKQRALAYKDFYLLINTYRSKKASKENQNKWKKFLKEQYKFKDIYKLIYEVKN